MSNTTVTTSTTITTQLSPQQQQQQQQHVLDSKLFARHLKALRSSWTKQSDLWEVDAFAIICGTTPSSDKQQYYYSKTIALQYWLCGYELTDTLMVICEEKVIILTGVTKEKLFTAMIQSFDEPINVTLLKRNKSEGDNAAFQNIIEHIKKSNEGKRLGTLMDEQQHGSFVRDWSAAISASRLKLVDVSSIVADTLSIKDANEQKCIRTASSISAAVVKSFLLRRIEDVIDEGASVTHARISQDTEELFDNPQRISPKLNPSVVDSCYTPVVQSGRYDLGRPTGPPPPPPPAEEDHNLEYTPGVAVVCSLGARYKAYCSDVARTYFVDPSEDQKEVYTALYEVHERVIKALKPGVRLSDVWRRAVESLDELKPELKGQFLPCCGTSIGLEYSDPLYSISEDCDKVVAASMVFNVRVGLKNLSNSTSNYAILLADTVLVGSSNNGEVLTKLPKKFSEVSYELSTDKEEENKPNKTNSRTDKKSEAKGKTSQQQPGPSHPPPSKPRPSSSSKPTEKRTTSTTTTASSSKSEEYALSSGFSLRRREKLNTINIGQRTLRSTAAREMKHNKNATAEAKRMEHQKQLERELIKKARQLLNKKDDDDEEENATKEYIAYHLTKDFPSEATRDSIYVDRTKEAILLPMYGLMVPFHVTTVKNISKTDDYIRIIFKHPVGTTTQVTGPNGFADPKATFIKELTYRVPDVNSLNNTIRLVNELKKRVNTRETEINQKATLKEQPPLVLAKNTQRIPRLSQLSVRPNISGRRTIGTLEAHTNGFRYSTSKGNVKIDVIYDNIKHAFFQHAENSLIVAVHFHLHNEILIGKKKSKDVQFYMEVMEVSTALSNKPYNSSNTSQQRSKYGDAEEIEDEQREREMRNKLNRDFQNFVKKVEEMVPTLEFDIPYRELGFYGVHFRNNVLLTPTVHCLINVIEYPFFVMSLDDVQMAYFERVQFSLRAFDLVFIFNDWTQKEVHINSIPVESLETIKDWLDTSNIKYYQGPTNLNWRGLLDIASLNPKKFWQEGGWAAVDHTNESGDEQEGQSQENDREPDDYRPSDTDEEDYEMDESDDEGTPATTPNAKGVGGGVSYGGGSALSRLVEEEDYGDDDDDEGLDWDELDARAVKQDMKIISKKRQEGDISDHEESNKIKRTKKR